MVEVFVAGDAVAIGRQAENEARTIYFNISDMLESYGEGIATLVHMRPSDQVPYVCSTRRLGTYILWTITDTDTAYAGQGRCELRWVVGDVLAKSKIYSTTIIPSITAGSVIPDPYESWYESLLSAIEEMAADQEEIDGIREKIKFARVLGNSSRTYQTDELALAALDDYGTEHGSGIYSGYILDFNSYVMGLPLEPHYYDFYVDNSRNRFLVAYSAEGSGKKIYLRAKTDGTWETGWTTISAGGGGGSSGVSSVNGMTGAVVIPTATTSVNGLMSSTDKSHLDTVYADYSSALTALGVI